MITILFIHQSAELYGSDKTLLLLLKYLDKTKFNAVVVLPNVGPLKTELEKENIIVIIAPVLKLYRKMFSPKNLITFFKDVKTGIKTLDDLNKVYQFDIVYSNTLAVLLGMIYAKKRKIKHIWHVHEIIESPRLFTRLFSKILKSKANIKIVYNSIATQVFWNVNDKISKKAIVICNGLEIPSDEISIQEKETIRKDYFNATASEIVIALVGRVSRWKGQLVLLEAFNELLKEQSNLKLIFIGSPPTNQENFLDNLNFQIEKHKISDKVLNISFQENVFDFWQSIDIAVVPSIEPEPFGLVAVEAMLAKKPVVASNHGGLCEIIVDNKTGFLVEPNNSLELAKALQKLISNPELRKTFGINGYERAITEFSVDKYIQSFEDLFEKLE